MADTVEIVVENAKAADRIRRAIPRRQGVHVHTGDRTRKAKHSFLVTSPSSLGSGDEWDRVHERLNEARRLAEDASLVVLLDDSTRIPWESLERVAAFSTWLGRRSRSSTPLVARDEATLRRLVLARRAGAHDKLIASADLEDQTLVVWSCEPRRYAVLVTAIPALAELSPGERKSFSLSESGSRLHWSAGDIDINLETIRGLVDGGLKRAQDRQRRREARLYSAAMREIRLERSLSQDEIPGLSERQVRRLELGTHVPHSDSLSKLAAAYGMDVNKYLSELAARAARHKSARLGGSKSRSPKAASGR